MLYTFRIRLEYDGEQVLSTVPTMRAFYQYVQANFDRLGFDADYQRRFTNRVRELEAAIDKITANR